jgi:hypothetical protein
MIGVKLKNLKLLIVLILLASSCGTFRPDGDEEIEAETGERTMTSVMNCWDVPACFKKSVAAAKEECTTEGKSYKFIRNLDQRVTYKCE